MKNLLTSLCTLFICLACISGAYAQTTPVVFDGITQFGEIPHHPAINFDTNDDFTVEVWLKAPSSGQLDLDVADNDVVEKWYQSGGYPFVIRYLNVNAGGNQGKISAARYDGTNNPGILSTATINDDTWHHIAFVKDGAMLYLYIDGTLDGSAPDNTVNSTQNNSSVYLARRGCCALDNFWTGEMDELRIWNVARTQMEIDNNKDMELAGTEAGLVAYYTFNEINFCTGETPDLTAAQNSGILYQFPNDDCDIDQICDNDAAPSPEELENGLISYWSFDGFSVDEVGTNHGTIIGNGFSYVTGKYGEGIDLDGGDTYVDAGNDASLDFTSGSVTISAWFRVDAFTDSWQALIAKGEGNNFRVHRYSNFNSMSYNGGLPDINSGLNVNDGTFHHIVAVTENGVSKNLYIDGVPAAVTQNNPIIADSGLSLLIGNNPDILSRDWNGVIDDVAIWDRALSPCEVATVYHSGVNIRSLLLLPAIPALSEWGIILLALILLIIGIVAIGQRRKSVTLS